MKRSEFEAVAERAFASLPAEILEFVENTVFLVEDWPDPETLQELGIPEREGLLGLYQGNPLTERSIEWSGALPDRIVLYQRPIELEAETEGLPVFTVIRETLYHEIGHHFGLEEEELLEMEEATDPELP